MKKLVLASQSPRRKEILKQVGLTFEIQPSAIHEHMSSHSTVQDSIEELALRKAKDVADKVQGDAIVLGADTIVLLDGKILGKPRSREDATSMLRALSGKTHSVLTGIAVSYTHLLPSRCHRRGGQTRALCFRRSMYWLWCL